MLKRIIELLDDRTVSSLLFSIAGLVIIMAFAYLSSRWQGKDAEQISKTK